MTPRIGQIAVGRRTARRRARVLRLVAISLLSAATASGQTPAGALYNKATARERALRENIAQVALADLRAAVRAYALVVRRYPRSGYSDNALWQGAGLARLAYERFQDEADRRTGERLLRLIKSEYPSSSLVPRVDAELKRFAAAAPVAATPAERSKLATLSPLAAPPASAAGATLRQLSRQIMPTGARVVIELDGDTQYIQDRLANPPRVFIDLRNTRVGPTIDPASLAATDDLIRAIRVGQRPDNTARVVMELTSQARYTVIALFDPYRLVIDFERGKTGDVATPPATAAAPAPASPAVAPPPPADAKPPAPVAAPPAIGASPPIKSTPSAPLVLPAPGAPLRNSDGTFSIARQLGLGISRIVIDPGHGGHDPGAQAFNRSEAGVVLDIALRLEALLLKEAGIEVVMTRRTDVFVSLEERTGIANREHADLFLSIHANASRNKRATGVETYHLNFATNPEAEQVAARENSASGRTMRNLSDIVQAIALSNKLDESRDFARFVQDAMVRRIKPGYRSVRNLGVKQAPFVVLIGAEMPSALAEVSFITNRAEASLLGKPSYRQRVAQGLSDAVMRYQRSLKNTVAVAQRSAQDGAREW